MSLWEITILRVSGEVGGMSLWEITILRVSGEVGGMSLWEITILRVSVEIKCHDLLLKKMAVMTKSSL